MGDWRCPECGEEVGGSHYHCPKCGGVCSMMGHTASDCAAYREKLGRRSRIMAKKKVEDETTLEVAAVEEAPILPGYEQDESLDTVTLIGGGAGDGTYRVVASLPHVVLANNDRYVLSDRAAKVYTWEKH